MLWHTRPAHEADIPEIVRLLDQTRQGQAVPYNLADVLPDLRAGGHAVVATVGNDIVGTVVARIDGDVGRLSAIAIAPEWRQRGIGSSLIEQIELALVRSGARRIVALLAEGQLGTTALHNRGFTATEGLTLYQKHEPVRPVAIAVLERWAGELVSRSRWTNFAGLRMQRQVVEQRVLAPFLEPDLAARFGVEPPTTMLLFGPPGTGKTSFAKAIAGRLGWPFVELLPSKLGAGGTAAMASELHDAFRDLLALDHVVVFIDEVDDIASSRSSRPETQAVVNELLKAIVRVRESPGRLLICATNSIRSLDAAMVRPGRFDLVLPVGPPDEDARRALLHTMLDPIPACSVEIEDLLAETAGLTPADLAAAVQRAAADAFQAARDSEPDAKLDTRRLRKAVASLTPTIGEAASKQFAQEAAAFSRF